MRQHILARGVVLREVGDEAVVLLAQQIGAANTFLPGGHIEPGEGLADSLAREIAEELGVGCRVGAFLGTVEAQWPDSDPQHYEVNQLFRVEFEEPDAALVSREAHLRFFWCPVGELAQRNLRPVPLRGLIVGYVAGDRGCGGGVCCRGGGGGEGFGGGLIFSARPGLKSRLGACGHKVRCGGLGWSVVSSQDIP